MPILPFALGGRGIRSSIRAFGGGRRHHRSGSWPLDPKGEGKSGAWLVVSNPVRDLCSTVCASPSDLSSQKGQQQRRVSAHAIPAEALASIDSSDKELRVSFDNQSDPECTVVTIEGSDQSNMLIRLGGAFSSFGVEVVGASISSDDGRIMDIFRVQMDGKKVRGPLRVHIPADSVMYMRLRPGPRAVRHSCDCSQVSESEFEPLKAQIVEMTSSSNRSTRPAIYGIVAAAEVERLRPLSDVTSDSQVETLELAAAEMAQVCG